MITRNETKKIRIGDRTIGGGSPVAIQSMTNTRTEDVEATVAQIQKLEQAGCEIIRCAVPTMEAAEAFCQDQEADPYSTGGRYSFRLQARDCGD